MRIFSKIAFICNCCFVAAVILRWVENSNKRNTDFSGVIGFQPLESTLVILGYGAIFVNLVYVVFYLSRKVFATTPEIVSSPTIVAVPPKPLKNNWLLKVNCFFIIAQIYYFFFTS